MTLTPAAVVAKVFVVYLTTKDEGELMQRLLIPIAISTLMGCATVQVPTAEAVPVPASRIYVAELVSATDANATFVRDSGIMGIGCTHDLYVGSVRVLSLEAGERATLKLPLGTHVMRVESPASYCATNTKYLTSTFAVGVPQVFRIYFDVNQVKHFARIQ